MYVAAINSFNTIHKCYELYKALDYHYFTYEVKQI